MLANLPKKSLKIHYHFLNPWMLLMDSIRWQRNEDIVPDKNMKLSFLISEPRSLLEILRISPFIKDKWGYSEKGGLCIMVTHCIWLLKCFITDEGMNHSWIIQLGFSQALIQLNDTQRMFVILDEKFSCFCPKLQQPF